MNGLRCACLPFSTGDGGNDTCMHLLLFMVVWCWVAVCCLLTVQSVVAMVETAARENEERAEAEKARIRREHRNNKR